MPQPKLTLLYDGQCALCDWERRNLSRRDPGGRFAFIDISREGFEAADYGTTLEALMGRIHAITDDGRMLEGVDVLLLAYRLAGWRLGYWPLRLMPRHVGDAGYRWFARHRHRISRRLGWAFAERGCDNNRCRL